MSNRVALPLVSINGSPAERLLEQQHDVAKAARALLVALTEADPNGRDFMPDDFEVARRAQVARHQQVRAIMQDAYAVMEHIQDVIDEKDRMRSGRSSGDRPSLRQSRRR